MKVEEVVEEPGWFAITLPWGKHLLFRREGLWDLKAALDLWAMEEIDLDLGAEEFGDCPTCKGAGHWDDVECWACKGTGRAS